MMFDDIRPYADAEVRPILERLLKDPELLRALGEFLWPSSPNILKPLLDRAGALFLRWQLRHVRDVASLQAVMGQYLLKATDRRSSGFTVSGLDNIPADRACLFIGNHRDIALDPAYMSLSLDRHGLDTCRIAIGDNLLKKPFVADIMRLNKCFVVNRSETAPRAMLKAWKQLSAYIEYSVVQERQSVWLAQREGRAKNGDDRTEPAIIKMLCMAARVSGRSVSEHLNMLHIVPVSISYEYDPCDAMKALELATLRTKGAYMKAEHEDVMSIAAGIQGQKGRVHLSFGAPIDTSSGQPEVIAAELDQAIHRQYCLQPSNLAAFAMQGQQVPEALLLEVLGPDYTARFSAKNEEFKQRVESEDTALHVDLIAMYAQPVHNRIQATSGSAEQRSAST